MKYKIIGVLLLFMVPLLLTGCGNNNKDNNSDNIDEKLEIFDEKSVKEEYKNNQAKVKNDYNNKNKKFIFYGVVESLENNPVKIQSQYFDYSVYFEQDDLLKMSNGYMVEFTGVLESISGTGDIKIKNAVFKSDNIELTGTINAEFGSCNIESNIGFLYINVKLFEKLDKNCTINSDTFSNGEEVKFTGKIKGRYTTHYTYEYVISSIDSIESINKDD